MGVWLLYFKTQYIYIYNLSNHNYSSLHTLHTSLVEMDTFKEYSADWSESVIS